MTQEKVHEMLCNGLSDEQKKALAIQCKLKGVDIKSLEELIAKVITTIEPLIEASGDTYKYLGGR